MIAALALAAAVTGASPLVLHRYESLVLNADASRIATVDKARVEGTTTDGHPAVVVRDPNGAVVQTYDPCAECTYDGPDWSADGERLAFVASHGGTATLYVARGATVLPLMVMKGNAGMTRWSPDGRSIALLVTDDARKTVGAIEAGSPRVGELGDAENDPRRIAIVDADSGTRRLVSPARTYVYEYDWLPDGSGFVGTAAEGNGDSQWWVARLVRFGLDGSARVIASPRQQTTQPRVSPDGRFVAFIGSRMSDFALPGGDVYVVPVDGGRPVDVTPNVKFSIAAIQWRGTSIAATVIVGGSLGAVVIAPDARRVSAIVPLAGHVQSGIGAMAPEDSGSGIAFDRTGRIAAYAVESFDTPPHIEYGPLGATRAITHDNDDLPSLAIAESVSWKSDGRDVQGWLLKPRGASGSARVPMITDVHGGPTAAFTPRYVFADTDAALLAKGYDVFKPNPRGSLGQGLAFSNANYRDFGGGDLRDILAGITRVTRIAPVDPQRLGIMGHSYGGFMAMWAVTHTTRFKAAVAGAGIANWVSYYGQNGIDAWMPPFFGATLYDDPRIYDRLSPIRSIKAARTPTFIYVGERDIECPPAQSEEFWHGLRAVGVPTSLVIYEGEGHYIRKREHRDDILRRELEWFERHLGTGDAAPASK